MSAMLVSISHERSANINDVEFQEASGGSEPTKNNERSDTVDLNENDILIDISDALSEKDKVKFTVHTKVKISSDVPLKILNSFSLFQTKLPSFQESDFSVTRQHEEFIWLHDRYNENEEYAGLIVRSIHRYLEENFLLCPFRFHLHHLDLISMHPERNYKDSAIVKVH